MHHPRVVIVAFSLLARALTIILGDFGLPVTGETLATSADEAAKASAKIGFPVAMKIQSPDVMHKSDAGGVVLGVKSAEEAKAAYETILKNVAKHHPKAQIDGVLIQEMVGKGTEMILGMNCDDVLGPVIVCGLGGIFVEIMKDTTLRFPPLSEREARDMLSGLKSMKLLEGYRGTPAGDIDALDRKSTRLNSSHVSESRMPSSA